MRRVGLALLILLVAATPALGDDTGRKHQIDSRIATLQNTLSAQRKREQSLRDVSDKAEELTARGVRRVFALFVKTGKVSVWSAAQGAFQDLDPFPELGHGIELQVLADRFHEALSAVRAA